MNTAPRPSWPAYCHDPSSCERHRTCMYHQCLHTGKGAALGAEIDAAWAQLSAFPPAADNLYRHYKGGLYRLLHEATNEATEEPVMVYRSEQDGRVWVRTVASWKSMVGAVPRFERVDQA